MFSYYADHYIRAYSQLAHSAKLADASVRNMGYIKHCFKCLQREVYNDIIPVESRLKCMKCGSVMKAAGPLWLGSLSNQEFCTLMLKNLSVLKSKQKKRLTKILSLVREESNLPVSYYRVDKLCGKLGVRTPSLKIICNRLKELGFRAVLTHFSGEGFKSDASCKTVKEVILDLA